MNISHGRSKTRSGREGGRWGRNTRPGLGKSGMTRMVDAIRATRASKPPPPAAAAAITATPRCPRRCFPPRDPSRTLALPLPPLDAEAKQQQQQRVVGRRRSNDDGGCGGGEVICFRSSRFASPFYWPEQKRVSNRDCHAEKLDLFSLTCGPRGRWGPRVGG